MTSKRIERKKNRKVYQRGKSVWGLGSNADTSGKYYYNTTAGNKFKFEYYIFIVINTFSISRSFIHYNLDHYR